MNSLLNLAANITEPLKQRDYRTITPALVESVMGVWDSDDVDTDDLWAECRPHVLDLTTPLANNATIIERLATVICDAPNYYLSDDQKIELIEMYSRYDELIDGKYPAGGDIADAFLNLKLGARQIWPYLSGNRA